MTPVRIKVEGECATSIEKWRENAQANSHHPRVVLSKPHLRKLAIVGGGPSVIQDLPELKAWDGDIWAINDTATWLTSHGVKCTLFTVDANQMNGDAENAVIATVCDPQLFAHFEGRVTCFDLIETNPEGFGGGAFSSTRAPAVSLQMGYIDVSFFGCESSFDGPDHVYRDEKPTHQLIVKAGENEFRTTPQYLVQCDELLNIFRFDNVYHNRSRGLVKAMQEHPDTWTVVAVSADLKAHLERGGPSGMYDEPYPLKAA